MTERRMQFRVGLFVLVSMGVLGGLILQFGEMKSLWQEHYELAIHFDDAPGLEANTPVRRNGVNIGTVRKVLFNEQEPGLTVLVEIRNNHRLRKDSQPRLVNSLLGDAAIEFSPGTSSEYLSPGAKIAGDSPDNPMEVVHRLEEKLTATLDSFHVTSRKWEQVADNVNGLMETNHGTVSLVVERAAESLHQFTQAMQSTNELLANANSVLADPRQQENLRQTLSALPDMVRDTREVIQAMRQVAANVDENLVYLKQVTGPLAKRSDSIVTNLDETLANMHSLSAELDKFSKVLAKEDGTVHRFIADPSLYRNLNNSATSLSVLLRNMEPVVRDLRYFSDKIARHPELLGIRGAVQGSSGLKDLPEDDSIYRPTNPPLIPGVRRE